MAYYWHKVSNADLLDRSNYTVESGKICNYCLSVVNFQSKHCKVCNKCIYRFDHHCNILNTCIGGSNYKEFIYLLLSLLVFNLSLSIFSIHTIIRYFKTSESSKPDSITQSKFSINAMIVTNFINFVLSVTIELFLTFLLIFHLYLKLKSMTTYEFICKRNAKTEISAMKVSNEMGINRTDIDNSRINPVTLT